MSFTYRVTPLGTTNQYLLPDVEDVKFSHEFSDTGAIELSYPWAGVNADKIDADSLITVYWNNVEARNMRFTVQAGSDSAKSLGDGYFKVVGKTHHQIFGKVVVNNTADEVERTYTFFKNTSLGTVLMTLFNDAQARGAMTGIDFDFTDKVDSAGVSWPILKNLMEYKGGVTYKDILGNLFDQGYIELYFQGDTLRIFNVDGSGEDHTAGNNPLVFSVGLNVLESPRNWTIEERAKYGIIFGDEGAVQESTSSVAPVGRYGREEMSISQGGMSDPGAMRSVLQAQLKSVERLREEFTRGASWDEDDAWIPLVNYFPADQALDRRESTFESYKIQSIVVTPSDASGSSGTASIVLNDKFLAQEIRNARRVNGIIGGATVGSTDPAGGGTPKPFTPPPKTPSAPAAVTNSINAYIDSNGDSRASATINWDKVDTNVDATPTDEVSGYDVRWKTAAAAPIKMPKVYGPGGEPYQRLNALFDRRQKPWGWIGGDGAASVRLPSGKDWWIFGDSAVGTVDGAGKILSPWGMVNNSIVETDPSNRDHFRTLIGQTNLLPKGYATMTNPGGGTWALRGGAEVSFPVEPDAFSGKALEILSTTGGAPYTYQARSGSPYIPVTPGETITIHWTARGLGLAGSRSAQFYFLSYGGSGSGGSGLSGSSVSVPADGSPVTHATTVVVPDGAAQVIPVYRVYGTEAGEAVRFYDLAVYRGDQRHQSWSIPAGKNWEAVVRPEASGWKALDYRNHSRGLTAAVKSGAATVAVLGDSISRDPAGYLPALQDLITGEFGGDDTLTVPATAVETIRAALASTAFWADVVAMAPGHGLAVFGANDYPARTAAQFAQDVADLAARWATKVPGKGLTVAFYPGPEDHITAARAALPADVGAMDLTPFLPLEPSSDALASAIFDRLQDPLSDYYWLGDGWTSSGKVYAQAQIIGPHWPTPEGWNFTYKGRTDLAVWDGTTGALLEVRPWVESSISWTNTVLEDAGWLYVFGHLSDSSAVVMRCDPADPFTNPQVWNGSGWVNDLDAAAPVTNRQTFSTMRNMGGTFHAYIINSFDTDVYEATAPNPWGPWTVQTESIYRIPEVGGKRYAYITRVHPQFDSYNGLVFGYSTNTTADWTQNVLHGGPRFAQGPAGERGAVDIENEPFIGLRSLRNGADETVTHVSPLLHHTTFYSEVRAVKQDNVVSAWRPSAVTLITGDTDAPNIPSTPITEPLFQGARIVWDGLDAYGSPPPNDWRWTEVHVAPYDNFEPTMETFVDQLTHAGTSVVQGLEAASTYYTRFVAVDGAGNKSEPSDVASFVTEQIVNHDLPDRLIDAAKLAEGSVYYEHLGIASFGDSMLLNGMVEEWDISTGRPVKMDEYWWGDNAITLAKDSTNPISGSTSLQVTIPKTATGERKWSWHAIPVVEKKVYYFTADVTTNVAVEAGRIQLYVVTGSTPEGASGFTGAFGSRNSLSNEGTNGNVFTFEGAFEVPVGMRFAKLVISHQVAPGQASDVVVTWDNFRMGQMTGSAEILEASIHTAHISYLNLNEGNVSKLNVGKLTSGISTADITISGRVMTSETRQRAEMNPNGFMGYNSSNELVTQIRSSDGGLVSRWFRTNTSGTRIEMGTYANGGNAATIAFFDSTTQWQFPPAMGFGGGGRQNFPGIGIHAGSISDSAYNSYGMNMMGVDQKGGIGMVTGNLLDGTQATTGAPITLNAGGNRGVIDIRAGSNVGVSDRARIYLSPREPGKWAPAGQGYSRIDLNFGILSLMPSGTYGEYSIRFAGDTEWGTTPWHHLLISAGYGGFRFSTANQPDSLIVTPGGKLQGSGWDRAVKLQAHGVPDNYVTLFWDGTKFGMIAYNEAGARIASKTF